MPVQRNLDAVLLDALGTLVALEPPPPLLAAEFRRRFAIELTEDEARRAIAAEITYYREHLDEGRDESALADLRRRCASALRAALPQSEAVAALDGPGLTDALLASLRFRSFPDAPAALASWRARGLKLIVVSNWDISLADVLARLQLSPLLNGVVTSASVGARKPSPEIFEHALDLAHAAPDRAIHIGDSVEEDVAGARAAGVEPVLLRRDGTPGPAGVRTITTLTELHGDR
jgi:putative hydrolase of the HAD superfamily